MANKNEVSLTGGQALQVKLIGELEKASEETGTKLTEYGKKCVISAIAAIVINTKAMKIELKDIDATMLRLCIQNIGYTELNVAAIPSEVYFDYRKIKDEKNNVTGYTIAARPQGAGNEKLVRKYGVGVKELYAPWIVHEGDEITLPSFNGLEMTPPTFKPKLECMNNKVIMVVYPLLKVDGSVEFLMATREGIKPNIIAQIRQNTLYEFKKTVTNSKGNQYEVTDDEKRSEFYKELDEKAAKMTVDQLIDEYADYINPTYTSGGSKEQMILRKMKNNALKYYPKEYDTTAIKEAVESMFEDRDDSLVRKPIDDGNVIDVVEQEIKETPSGEPVADFDADGVKVEPAKADEKKIKIEPVDESDDESDNPYGDW